MSEHELRLLKLFSLLQQVLTRVGAQQTPTGAKLGLTNLQLGVLGAVYSKDNCTMSELAQDRFVVPSAATRMAEELVKKGLLERTSDPGDRRIVRLRITPQGRDALDRVHQEAADVLSTLLGRMTEEEQVALLKGLESFINAVTQLDAAP